VSLGEWTFAGCTALEEVSLPTGLLEMGDYCFVGCTGLRTATLPSDLLKLPNGSFEGCTALLGIVIPEGMKVIGDYAFYACGDLEISLPSTLERVGGSAFDRCEFPSLSYSGSAENYEKLVVAPKNGSLKEDLAPLVKPQDPTPPPNPPAFLPEDVDESGTVDISDVTALVKALAGGDDRLVDVNGDSAVDISDVTALLAYLAGNGAA
jgi:hypothetical protein